MVESERLDKLMKEDELKRQQKTGDFLHEAFCVDGMTKFIKVTEPTAGFNCDGLLYEIKDKKRGLFYVAIYKPR